MKTNISPAQFETIKASIGSNVDGLFLKHTQEIPDDYLRELSDARLHTSSNRAGSFHRVASVPVAVVDKWRREGFDIYAEDVTPRQIIARLSREDLGAFITTTKRV